MDKQALHRLVDQLPEVKTDEAARLLVALLRQDDEDHTWLDAGASALWDRLTELEADLPAEERQAWLNAFERNARPCTYVPGQGFVPLP